jgi:hypothetical protein
MPESITTRLGNALSAEGLIEFSVLIIRIVDVQLREDRPADQLGRLSRHSALGGPLGRRRDPFPSSPPGAIGHPTFEPGCIVFAAAFVTPAQGESHGFSPNR